MADVKEPAGDTDKDDKKDRVYKGTKVPISKLVIPAVVQSLPGTREDIYNKKVPLFMYVEAVAEYTPREKILYYRDPRNGMKQNYLYLKSGYEVNALSGRMGAALMGEINEYKKAHLGESARWPGGSVGCDPEIFIVDKAGVMIPAFNFLTSKKHPKLVTSRFFDTYIKEEENHKTATNRIYWDGFQAEFTTRPFGCLAHECDSIWEGLDGLYKLMKKYDEDARLSMESVLPVPDGALETAKDEHVEFGCMPSLNAYGLEGNKTPGRQVPIRFAGGHLHFGIGKTDKDKADRIVKWLDRVIGVGSVALFAGYENEARRRFYGLPGEYRLPPHGIEYRTLPNAWLAHPFITNVVYETARMVVGLGGSVDLSVWDSSDEEIIETIVGSDVERAKKILERNKAQFTSMFNQTIFSGQTETLYRLFYGGMGEVLEYPKDIEKNWNLGGTWVAHCEGTDSNWRHGYPRLAKGEKLRPSDDRHQAG